MKETGREIMDEIIFNLKKVSEVFQVIEMEGGEEFYFELGNKASFGVNIIYNGSLFNIDYKDRLPVKQENQYSKWIPSMFEIMRVISDINNILLKSSLQQSTVKRYLKVMSTLTENCETDSFEEMCFTAS